MIMKGLKTTKFVHRMLLTVIGVFSSALISAQAQPTISVQPKDSFVDLGKNTSLFISTSSGAGTLTYQWFFNGAEQPGATNRILTLFKAQLAMTGDYFVIVSNASGSVTSKVARVTVFAPAPHGFSSVAPASDGAVQLELAGETPALFHQYFDLYPLEVSSNLAGWAPLTTLVRTNESTNSLRFRDTNARNFKQRFYRTLTNRFITPLPKPTGPYEVGTFSRLLTDPSRTNRARRTNQQFMITVWYPAIAQSGQRPSPYLDKTVAQNSDIYMSFIDRVPAFVSHSFTNAPLSDSQVKYPVLLYSCGGILHRRDNASLTEDLASWGYIVVGMDHRDTTVSVFPDGKVVYTTSLERTTFADYRTQLDDRVLDARFVLDEITRWNSTDPVFSGRLSLERIGAFGWSYGGSTVAELARVDSRCRASVNLDGIFGKTNLLGQPLHTPFMILREMRPDPDPAAIAWIVPIDDRLAIFNALATNAYWVKITNAAHLSYGDHGVIWDPVSLATDFGAPGDQQIPGLRVRQITRAYLRSFFNKFILGEDDHLLDGPSPDYPEVMQFLKK
jgi:predicted dienelactone hydrolase